MSDTKKAPATSPQPPAGNPPADDAVTSQQLIDEVADEMAGAAGKAENRYDEGHDIFTK